MSLKSFLTQENRMALAADGCLFTAGAYAVLTSMSFVFVLLGVEPMGSEQPSALLGVLSVVAWLFGVAGFVVGPYLAWHLHDRRVDKFALGGAAAGWVVGGAVVSASVMLIAALSGLLGLVLPGEFTGPLVMLAIVAAAFITLVIWLAAKSVRDLASAHEHTTLDIWRLVATLSIVAFSIVVTFAQMANPAGEVAEAAIFMLAGGVLGGVGVLIADIVTKALNPQAPPHAIAGA